MIEIKEAISRKERNAFFHFPFKLYSRCKQWVPPITKEEKATFDTQKNPVFNKAEAKLFLAYNNQTVVGRLAAMVNWVEVNEQQKPKIRFGWYDVEDDIEISRALLDHVAQWGRELGLQYVEGPKGFSNMDKAGLLVYGFEHLNTMITWYHYPYQKEHLEQLGFKKQAEWIEFKIEIYDAKDAPEKVTKFAEIVKKRYQLTSLNFTSTKELLPYVDEMFELLNHTYKHLQSFVPIQPYQVAHYKKKYIPYIDPEFIKCVVDEQHKLVAFTITMPSFSDALKKANGKMFPFGFLHVLKARQKNNKASFYLIGIDPKYQNKGVTAIIFDNIQKLFNKRGITLVETNPELEENTSIQLLWKNYKHELHKRRRTYKKDL